MQHTCKRLLSLVLVVLMLFSMMPTAVFAAEEAPMEETAAVSALSGGTLPEIPAVEEPVVEETEEPAAQETEVIVTPEPVVEVTPEPEPEVQATETPVVEETVEVEVEETQEAAAYEAAEDTALTEDVMTLDGYTVSGTTIRNEGTTISEADLGDAFKEITGYSYSDVYQAAGSSSYLDVSKVGYVVTDGTTSQNINASGDVTFLEDGHMYTVTYYTVTNTGKWYSPNYVYSLKTFTFTYEVYYNVTVSCATSGGGAVYNDTTYADGSVIEVDYGTTVTYTTVTDYEINSVSYTGTYSNESIDSGLTPTSSGTLTINYSSTAAPKHTVTITDNASAYVTTTVTAAGTTISSGAEVSEGDSVVITATPKEANTIAPVVTVNGTAVTLDSNYQYSFAMGDTDTTIAISANVLTGNATAEVEYNPAKSIADQLDELEEEIFTKVVTSSVPEGVTVNDVTIQYYPEEQYSVNGNPVGDPNYDDEAYDLTYEKPDYDITVGRYNYRPFGDDGAGSTEKVKITWGDVYIEAEITLVDCRPTTTITTADVSITAETADDVTEAVIRNAIIEEGASINNGDIAFSTATITISDYTFPSEGESVDVSVTVTLAETVDYQGSSATATVTIYNPQHITATGSNCSVEVYSDADCTNKVTNLDRITSGTTVYVKAVANTGHSLSAMTINGDAVEFDSNGVYSFTTENTVDTYAIVATATINQYTITFNTNGGSDIAAITQDYGTAVTAPADPTKEGYTFAGWDKTIPETMPAENVTITAQWTVNQYTITFANTGDTVIADITQDYGTAVTAPEDPTKTGYTFAGWDVEIPSTMPAEDITITATWTVNQYTITFANTGDTAIGDITQDYGTTVTAPADPEKEGYTFTGWDVEIPETMPAEDMTITATWTVNSYTVTWIVDGVETVQTYEYGATITAPTPTKDGYKLTWNATIPATMPAENLTFTAVWVDNAFVITWDIDGEKNTDTYELNAAVTAPADPTKEGHTFAGWTDGTTVYQADEEGTYSFPPATQDVTYTATWTVNQYTITWNVDGTETEATYDYGSAVTAPADPTKTGYTFNGWDKDIPATMPAEDMTITATWTINQYTITFDTDGGSEIADITQDYGTDVTAPADPAKTGYTFAGWDKDIPSTMPAENVTITATWTINQYTITFDTDGGSEIAAITQDYNTAVTAPADPTKTGHTFAGWDVEIPATMPAENITITAQWTVNQYTITFDTDGGSEVATITQDYGSAVTAPADPTKDNYVFTGWNTEIPATMPAENITITAQWAADNNNNGVKDSEETATITVTVTGNAADEVSALTLSTENEKTLISGSDSKWTVVYDSTASSANVITVNTTVPESTDSTKYTVTVTPGASLTVTGNVDVTVTVSRVSLSGNETGSIPFNGGQSAAEQLDALKSAIFAAVAPTSVPESVTVDDVTIEYYPYVDESYYNIFTGNASVSSSYYNDSAIDLAETLPEDIASATAVRGHYYYAFGERLANNGAEKVKISWTSGGVTVFIEAEITLTESRATNNVSGETEAIYPVKGQDSDADDTLDIDEMIQAAALEKAEELYGDVGGSFTVASYDTSDVNSDALTNVTVTVTRAADAYYLESTATITVPVKYFVDTDGDTYEDSLEYTATWLVDSNTHATQLLMKLEDGTFQTAAAVADPTKTAVDKVYTFTGWSDPVVDHDAMTITYTAQFSESVRYYTVKWIVDGAATTESIAYGEEVVAPADPVKEGYTFTGWDGYTAGMTITGSDLTFTAQFSINSYTVTWIVDGETYATDNVAYGAAITLPEEPTKEGYNFGGWGAVPATMPAENLTFTAQWTLGNTVTWYIDGAITTENYATGETIVAPANPTKTGYTFQGWDGYTEGMTMGEENLTFTALWTANSYTITWNVDGETYDTANVTYDTAINVPATNPIKEGHTFQGWFTEENGQGTEITADTIYQTANNSTYYAYFTANSYTVTWTVDGETYATTNVTYGTAITAPETNPSKDGYVFVGWLDADGNAPSTMPAEALEFTATWLVDANSNGVADKDETATVTLSQTGSGSGSVTVTANSTANTILTDNGNGTYTVVYNSKLSTANVITITVDPTDDGSYVDSVKQGDTDLGGSYSATVYTGTFTVTGDCTVTVDYGMRTITVPTSMSYAINGYTKGYSSSTVYAGYQSLLSAATMLNADGVVFSETAAAADLTVQMQYTKIENFQDVSAWGSYSDIATWYGTTAFDAPTASKPVRIVWNGTDKYPTVTSDTITVNIVESRVNPVVTQNTTAVTLDAAPDNDTVKSWFTVTTADGTTTIPASSVTVTDVTLPAEGDTTNVGITVTVAANQYSLGYTNSYTVAVTNPVYDAILNYTDPTGADMTVYSDAEMTQEVASGSELPGGTYYVKVAPSGAYYVEGLTGITAVTDTEVWAETVYTAQITLENAATKGTLTYDISAATAERSITVKTPTDEVTYLEGYEAYTFENIKKNIYLAIVSTSSPTGIAYEDCEVTFNGDELVAKDTNSFTVTWNATDKYPAVSVTADVTLTDERQKATISIDDSAVAEVTLDADADQAITADELEERVLAAIDQTKVTVSENASEPVYTVEEITSIPVQGSTTEYTITISTAENEYYLAAETTATVTVKATVLPAKVALTLTGKGSVEGLSDAAIEVNSTQSTTQDLTLATGTYTVTATPDTDNGWYWDSVSGLTADQADGDAAYVGTITVEDGTGKALGEQNTYDVAVVFEQRVLTLKSDAEIGVTGWVGDGILKDYSDRLADYQAGLTVDNLLASATGDGAQSFTIQMNTATGWMNISDLNAYLHTQYLDVPATKQVRIIWAADGKYPEVVAEGSVKIVDSRATAGLVTTTLDPLSYNNADEVLAYVTNAANSSDINPNGLTVTVEKASGEFPEKAGDSSTLTYTVTFAGSADYQPGSCTLTVTVTSNYDNCTVAADETVTTGGTMTVIVADESISANDDGSFTVPGNSTITVVITPAANKAVDTITVVNKTTGETVTTSAISYSSKAATVTFTSGGAEGEEEYTVSATYSDVYLTLNENKTIVYCLDNDGQDGLKKLVFDAVYGSSNPALTVENVTVEYAYIGAFGYSLWGDVTKDPSFNIGTHKFGEDGSETIRVTYEDAKYGTLQAEVALNVFDSCYNNTIQVKTVTNGVDASFTNVIDPEGRAYLGITYYRQDTSTAVQLTPDGNILDTLEQMYNGTTASSMPYIESVTVKDSEGNTVESTLTRGKSELSLDNILSGVTPNLYYATATFTTGSDTNYIVTAEYGVLTMAATDKDVTLEMYQGGEDYDPKVPSAEEIFNAVIGDCSHDFLEDYSDAMTVEFSADQANYTWTEVSDEALLALADNTTIKVRVTWNGDDTYTYYPVSITKDVTLLDQRIATSIDGTIPTEPVEFVEETQLIESLKETLGLTVLDEAGTAIDGADYTVTYEITGDETNGYFATVTVTYDGSSEYKPSTTIFENVPIQDIPDNATVTVTIVHSDETVTETTASAVITNNNGTEQTAMDGVYTVLGNGSYTFALTPAAGYAIESLTYKVTDEAGAETDGEAVTLTYEDQVASVTLTLDEKLSYAVTVNTIPSVFGLKEERVYDLKFGYESPVNEDIVDAAVATPEDIDLAQVKIEYLARTEGTATIEVPDIVVIDGILTIPAFTFDVDLGELWLDPNAEIKEVDLEEVTDFLVDDLVNKVLSGELSVNEVQDYVTAYVKSLTLNARAFGSNGDGSTETIRMSYEDDKYLIEETITDITIHDPRIATTLEAADCTVTYGYSLAQLLDAAGAAVMADGAALSGAAITGKTGLHADEDPQEVTLSFAGDADHQPCEITINVTVNKADCDIDYDSQFIYYGDDYDFSIAVSPEVMPDGTASDIQMIEFMIGLDMHTLLDVDIEDKDIGLDQAISYIQVRLPESIRNMPVIGEYLQGEMTLNDFISLMNSLTDMLGIDESSMETFNQVMEAITGITDNMEIRIKITEEELHPTNIGVYIAGAVTVDSDFNTAYTADYLIIAPKTVECELAWDYIDENNIMTLPVYKEIFSELMGAHVVENVDTGMTGDTLDTANSHVKYLILAVNDETSEFLTTDVAGNIKANIYVSPEDVNDNGAYVEIAYMLNWGNEIYYAMPIVRTFVIVPDTVDVKLLDHTGAENDDLLKSYNGEPQGFDVKVTTKAGEEIVNTTTGVNVNDAQQNLTVSYIGLQTDISQYNSTEMPTHAGAYLALAVYAEYDANDDLIVAGMDIGYMVIEPSESTVEVESDAYLYDTTAHHLNDQVTTGSVNTDETPDATVITAQLAVNGDFSAEGFDAVDGTMNIDFPAWLDALLLDTEAFQEGVSPAYLLDFMNSYYDDVQSLVSGLSGLGMSAVDVEAALAQMDSIFSELTGIISQIPEDVVITFYDDVTATNIGVYLVMGIVTDPDHYPSVDAGIVIIYPVTKEVELKFNEDWNGNNIFTWAALQNMDLDAKAYDVGTDVVNEEATQLVTNVYIGFTDDGEFLLTDDKATLDNGAYTQFAVLLDLGNEMYYAVPIARAFIITPNPATVEFIDENGNVNPDRLFEFDNEPHAMDVRVTVDGEVVAEPGDALTVTYVGLQTNLQTYNSTEPPVHAGSYVVTATYAVRDEQDRVVTLGIALGAMMITPTEATLEVDNKLHEYDGTSVGTTDMVTVGSTVDGLTPDATIITAAVSTNGTFSENTLDAITGNVNIDFPAWLDAYIAENDILSDGVSVAGVIAAIEKIQTQLTDLGIELDVFSGLLNVLEQLPADASLTFEDNAQYSAVGTYLVIGVVTDSDHYPAMDVGMLIIHPAMTGAVLHWIYEDTNNIFTLDTLSVIDLGAYATVDGVKSDAVPFEVLYMGVNAETQEITLTYDQADLDVGIYTEIAYVLDVDSNMYVAVPIIRPVIITPNAYDVQFQQDGVEVTDTVEHTYDGTPKSIGDTVVYDQFGNDITANGDLTVTYIGVTGRIEGYLSSELPTEAGVYTVVATFVTYDEESNISGVGAKIGTMVIHKAELPFALLDTTVTYDGKDHFVDVTNPLGADYISVVLDNDVININFPSELDALVDYLPESFAVEDLVTTLEKALNAVSSLNIGTEYIDKIKSAVDTVNDMLTAETITINGQNPVNAGSYPVIAITYSANYNSVTSQSTLTILPVQVVVTADDYEKYYGEADPEFTYDTIFVDHEGNEVDLTTDVVVNLYRLRGNDVGTYPIYVSATVADTNFAIKPTDPGTLTIKPAEVILTVANGSKVYGTDEPDWDNWDVVTEARKGAILDPIVVDSFTREEGENVGKYNITATVDPAKNPNYSITVVDEGDSGFGIFEITKANAVVTVSNATKVYGTNDPDFELASEIEGLADELDVTFSRTEGEDVGAYTISAALNEEHPNYNITFAPGTLTITKAEATVTVDNVEKYYGDPNPSIGYTCSVDGLSLNVTIDTSSVGANVGTYPINATCAQHKNYNITVIPGTLTIKPAEITMAVASASKTYGQADPLWSAWSVVISAVNGEIVEPIVVDSFTREEGENVGKYNITATVDPEKNPNYSITVYDEGDNGYGIFEITQASITVTIRTASKTYGEADPEFSFTCTPASAAAELEKVMTLTNTVGENANAGFYPEAIQAVFDNTANPDFFNNYNITVNKGTLIVNKASITLTVADASKTYGEEDPAFTFTPSLDGLTNVEFTRAEGENVGTYNITATAQHPNYNITINPGTLTITQAETSVKVEDVTTVYGEDVSFALSPSIDGLSVTYTVTDSEGNVMDLSNTLDAGTYTVTATVGEHANYIITEVLPGTLTITKADATVTVKDATKVYGTDDPTFEIESTIADLDVNDLTKVEFTREVGTDVGTYAINATAEHKNYNITVTPGTLTITKATVTVTVSDAEVTYGKADPAFKFTCVPESLKEFITVKNTALDSVVDDDGILNAGTYEDVLIAEFIDTESSAAKNYELVVETAGNLTVKPIQVYITVNDLELDSKVENPESMCSYTAVDEQGNPVDITALNPEFELTATDDENVFTITLKVDENSNYVIVENNPGTLTITYELIDIAITVADVTITEGDAITEDTFSYTVDALPEGVTADMVKDDLQVTYTITDSEGNEYSVVKQEDGTYVITDKDGNAAALPAGTYTVSATVVSTTYNVTVTAGTLTVEEAESYKTYFTGMNYQVGLIEPWFLRLNLAIAETDSNGNPVITNGSYTMLDDEDVSDVTFHFVRNNSSEALTAKEILSSDDCVSFSQANGEVFYENGRFCVRYRDEIYTYRMGECIHVVVTFTTADGEKGITAVRDYVLIDCVKERSTAVEEQTEVEAYLDMIDLYNNVTAYRSTFGYIEQLQPFTAPTIGSSTLANVDTSNLAENPFKMASNYQIMVIEPWGIRLNEQAIVDSDYATCSLSQFDDYGVVVYHDTTGSASISSKEDLLNEPSAYVFDKNSVMDNGDGTFSLRYNKGIFTYQLDADLYYMFYVVEDGIPYFFGLQQKNLYDMIEEATGMTASSNRDTYEIATYNSMLDLYGTVTAYREAFFAKNSGN